jgi:hypothetical protein
MECDKTDLSFSRYFAFMRPSVHVLVIHAHPALPFFIQNPSYPYDNKAKVTRNAGAEEGIYSFIERAHGTGALQAVEGRGVLNELTSASSKTESSVAKNWEREGEHLPPRQSLQGIADLGGSSLQV